MLKGQLFWFQIQIDCQYLFLHCWWMWQNALLFNQFSSKNQCSKPSSLINLIFGSCRCPKIHIYYVDYIYIILYNKAVMLNNIFSIFYQLSPDNLNLKSPGTCQHKVQLGLSWRPALVSKWSSIHRMDNK